MTKQAGQPFDWTAWRCCEVTTMPMNRTTGTDIRPCGGRASARDDPKAPFRLAHEGTLNDGCFDNIFFYEAFHEFDNQSIEKSLTSENPLVRVFALLDRRLGKRRLLALEESMEQELDWVRAFYVIRMQAEGLMEKE